MQTYPKTIAEIAEQCRQAQAGADTYTGDDGPLHCAYCNAPRQAIIEICGRKGFLRLQMRRKKLRAERGRQKEGTIGTSTGAGISGRRYEELDI